MKRTSRDIMKSFLRRPRAVFLRDWHLRLVREGVRLMAYTVTLEVLVLSVRCLGVNTDRIAEKHRYVQSQSKVIHLEEKAKDSYK